MKQKYPRDQVVDKNVKLVEWWTQKWDPVFAFYVCDVRYVCFLMDVTSGLKGLFQLSF